MPVFLYLHLYMHIYVSQFLIYNINMCVLSDCGKCIYYKKYLFLFLIVKKVYKTLWYSVHLKNKSTTWLRHKNRAYLTCIWQHWETELTAGITETRLMMLLLRPTGSKRLKWKSEVLHTKVRSLWLNKGRRLTAVHGIRNSPKYKALGL